MKLREVNIKIEEGDWFYPPKFAVVNKNNNKVRIVCCFIDDAFYLANHLNGRYNSDPYKVMEIIDDSL